MKGKPHYHKKRTSKNSNSQNSSKRVKGSSGKPRLFPTVSEDKKTGVWWKDYTPRGRVRDALLSSNVCHFLRSYGTAEILQSVARDYLRSASMCMWLVESAPDLLET